MEKFMAAVGRYSGYTRFLNPAWVWYYTHVEQHPKTSAVIILVLLFTQFV
jgi:hypothetical protein